MYYLIKFISFSSLFSLCSLLTGCSLLGLGHNQTLCEEKGNCNSATQELAHLHEQPLPSLELLASEQQKLPVAKEKRFSSPAQLSPERKKLQEFIYELKQQQKTNQVRYLVWFAPYSDRNNNYYLPHYMQLIIEP